MEITNHKGGCSMPIKQIILFDGECNFCDRSVQFIIKRDPQAVFNFASLQSETGKELLASHLIPEDNDSIVLISGERAYQKSTATLQIAKQLKGLWKLCYIFIILPRPIRDFFYDKFAKNRYKWFGRKDNCAIPSPEIRKRFL